VTTSAIAALILWSVLSVASLWVWLPTRPSAGKPLLARTATLVAVLVILVVGTGLVAVLGAGGEPVSGPLTWVVISVAAAAALLTGGAVTSCVLDLADGSSRRTGVRVRRTVLRGGAWIGALERLGIVATLLARWPDGLAVILAVKGLARYPELKTGPSSGAAERFIIGTFASIGWAAGCAGVAWALIR
jgi:hypothetical protein